MPTNAREATVVALGGLGEVGMNCMAIETEGRILVLDCGLTFPDREPGVDVIRPSFEHLLARADDVEAIVLTHGHDDHVGAVGYLLEQLDLPVFGPPYALGLLERRLSEFDLEKPAQLTAITPRCPINLGPFEVEPIRVTHSIPDATALRFGCGAGTLLHSGDFKIDPEPCNGEPFDAERLGEIGEAGVDLLLSDSTNIETPGTTGSEAVVAAALQRHVAAASGRVVVCMFASNVQRLGAVMRAARGAGRRVMMLGRSILNHAEVSARLGLLDDLPDDLVTADEAHLVPARQLLVVATGSQAEPRAALGRLARGEHDQLQLDPGDTVIFSSRIIPGKERDVYDLMNLLQSRGFGVLTRRDDPELHVSGHACRDEQQRMLELTRPRSFVPVHGTPHHRLRHAELARSLGVQDTLVAHNGEVVQLQDGSLRVVDEVPTGRVHIQAGSELADAVMDDREKLADYGIVVVAIQVEGGGRLKGEPQILTRGVVHEGEDRDLIDDARHAVRRALARLKAPKDQAVRDTTARAVRRVFRDAMGWRPQVHVLLHGSAR